MQMVCAAPNFQSNSLSIDDYWFGEPSELSLWEIIYFKKKTRESSSDACYLTSVIWQRCELGAGLPFIPVM